MSEYVSLKEYFDTQLLLRDNATKLAKESMEYRLDSMNEFREALRDATNNQVSKVEFNTWQSRIEEDIRSLRESRSLLEGKATQASVTIVTILTVISLLISIISIILGL